MEFKWIVPILLVLLSGSGVWGQADRVINCNGSPYGTVYPLSGEYFGNGTVLSCNFRVDGWAIIRNYSFIASPWYSNMFTLGVGANLSFVDCSFNNLNAPLFSEDVVNGNMSNVVFQRSTLNAVYYFNFSPFKRTSFVFDSSRMSFLYYGIHLENINASLILRNSTFTNNNIYGSVYSNLRGSVYALFSISNGKQLEVINCTFTQNTVNYGSLLTAWGSASVLVTDSYFRYTSTAMGTITLYTCSNVSFEKSTFMDNSGGTSTIYVVSSFVSFNNLNFTKNSGGAGAISSYSSSLLLENSSFSSNSGSLGGAISLYSSSPIIRLCLFNSNTAQNGGAIYLQYSDTTISNSTFTANSATFVLEGTGGAIYSESIGMELALFGNLFEDNSASKGGAVGLSPLSEDFISGNISFTSSYNVYRNNKASVEGGAFISRGSSYQWSDDRSSLSFSFDKFINNNAANRGGAMATSGTDYLTVNYSHFISNSANVEGGTFSFQQDPAAAQGVDYKFVGIIVDKSSAPLNGGTFLIKAVDNFLLQDSIITKSSTTLEGGSIQLASNIVDFKIVNTKFVDSSSVLQGGVINIDPSTNLTGIFSLKGTEFRGSSIRLQGSAVNIQGNLTHIEVVDSTFINCTGFEGTLYVASSTSISSFSMINSSFTGSDIKNSGGGLYMATSLDLLNISQCQFISNTVKSEGSAVYLDDVSIDSVIISESYFGLNKASSGVISGAQSTVINSFRVVHSIFANNYALTGTGGGLNVPLPTTSYTVKHSQFSGNLATQGGAIYFPKSSASSSPFVNFFNTSFDHNVASISTGGAIAFSFTIDEEIWVDTCLFDSNKANLNGGSIWASDVSLRIANSNFSRSSLSGVSSGSAVFFDSDKSLSVINSTFSEGSLFSGDGTAIFFKGRNSTTAQFDDSIFNSNSQGSSLAFEGEFSSISLIGGRFSNNSSPNSGSSVHFASGSCNEFKIESVMFNGNSAPLAGAMDLQGNIDSCSIVLSHFIDNSATDSSEESNSFSSGTGGAIRISSDTLQTIISSTTFSRNAALVGGAIFSFSPSLMINSCNFESNKATNGGGIAVFSSNNVITNSSFDGNIAKESGSSVWLGSASSLFLQYTNIVNSTSSSIATLDSSSNMTVVDCYFANNTATSGGALNVMGKITVSRTSFESNSATKNGGGIVYTYKNSRKRQDQDALFIFMDNILTKNNATDGGAIYLNSNGDSSLIQIKNNEFGSNSAERGGSLSFMGSMTLTSNSFTNGVAKFGSALAYGGGNGEVVSSYNTFGGKIYVPVGSNLVFTSSMETAPAYECEGRVTKGDNGGLNCDTSSLVVEVTERSSSSVNVLVIIIPCVVGGVVLIAVVIVLSIYLRKRNRRYQRGRRQRMILSQLMLSDVEMGALLGKGNFGAVYKGVWNGTTVALKGLTGEDQSELQKFKSEITLLYKLNHPNIVRLLGLHVTDQQTFMVVEYAQNGSLDSFLRSPGRSDELSNNALINMAFDVVKGMMYIHKKGVIHRDLSARNLLVDNALHIKISDFGLSKENDYYDSKSKAIPYKWTAPEVITEQRSTQESDVWSFGVVCWEIFSFGLVPFGDFSNKEAVDKVMEGYRMPKPQRCPELFYDTVLSCWNKDYKLRPPFTKIYQILLESYPNALKEEEKIEDESEDAGFYVGGPVSEIEMKSLGSSEYKYQDQL